MTITDRGTKEQKEIEAIIERAKVCRIGMWDGKIPYIVPMNFGYKENCLYFHCGKKGKKIDIIKQYNDVCFEMDIDHVFLKPEGRPCGWDVKYQSIIGFGKALIVETIEEKSEALNIIIQHYVCEYYPFSKDDLEKVNIIKIEIASITRKIAA